MWVEFGETISASYGPEITDCEHAIPKISEVVKAVLAVESGTHLAMASCDRKSFDLGGGGGVEEGRSDS